MSEQIPDPTPEPGTPEPDPVEQSDDVAALRNEAASRRRALRATEAERDTLRTRLDDHDRREVERLAGDRLQEPADLWLATNLEDMRGEDGALDTARVTEQLDRVLEEKPHWRKTVPTPDLHQGPRDMPPSSGPSFGESIKKALRG